MNINTNLVVTKGLKKIKEKGMYVARYSWLKIEG